MYKRGAITAMGYEYTVEHIIKAIEGSAGIITDIAKTLGCAWHTAEKHIMKHEETKQAYADQVEAFIDIAESELKKKLKEGDSQMIKFFLATKGKKRGYTEKHEIEHTGEGLPVNITIKGVE